MIFIGTIWPRPIVNKKGGDCFDRTHQIQQTYVQQPAEKQQTQDQ